MCTLTFIPKPNGYLLGMNRDERTSREVAQGPVVSQVGGMDFVYPREAGGGSWIATNAAGITLALLNRNPGAAHVTKVRSRGEIIPELVRATGLQHADKLIQKMDLRGLLPFQLLGFFFREKSICLWQWDGTSLQPRGVTWGMRHWFSSGISDALARQMRGLTCYDAWRRRNAGSLEWLRGLHASHSPVQGSFSICVHRPDTASVSYTEVVHGPEESVMRYHAGHPCQAPGRFDTQAVIRPFWPRPLAAAS